MFLKGLLIVPVLSVLTRSEFWLLESGVRASGEPAATALRLVCFVQPLRGELPIAGIWSFGARTQEILFL